MRKRRGYRKSRRAIRRKSALYSVKRMFTSGVLKGLTHTQKTPIKFQVGKVYKQAAGGGSYKVVSCRKAR